MDMRRFFVGFLVLLMAFAIVMPAIAAPAPVPGNPGPKMDWNPRYAEIAPKLTAIESPRQNASGDKITSNAHSADYPGLYFYWNDKQKDDGVLLVDPAVFDLFVGGQFILTAKNSNAYWGYVISPATGVLDSASGLYVYGIPRNFMYLDKKGKQVKEELKNINMVFIDGTYKSGWATLIKLWEDGDGEFVVNEELNALVTFTGLKLGLQEIKIGDYTQATKGKKITVGEIFDEDEVVYVYSKIDGEDAIAKPREVLVNKVPKTAYEVSLSVRPEKNYIVEFGNKEREEDPYKGMLNLEKYVDGTPFGEWFLDLLDAEKLDFDDLFEIISTIVFEVYAVDFDGDDNFTQQVSIGDLGLDGLITFSPSELEPGWYAIVEVMWGKAEEVFVPVDPLYIYVGEDEFERSEIAIVSKDGLVDNMAAVDGGFRMPGELQSILESWTSKLSPATGPYGKEALGDAVWVWDVANPSEVYGVSGSVVKFSYDFVINGVLPEEVLLHFACDNAAVVYVNGELVGYTYLSMRYEYDNQLKDENAFGDLTFNDFDGGQWGKVYTLDIAEHLKQGGNNITFHAANSRRTEGTGTINDTYDETNNPAGLIFSCVFETSGDVFNNYTEQPGSESAAVSFNKVVLGGKYDNAAPAEGGFEFFFDLYKLEQGVWVLVNDVDEPFATDMMGSVVTPDLELGSYKFVERLDSVWTIEQQYSNGIFFEIRKSFENPRVIEVVWAVTGEEAPTVVNAPKLGSAQSSVTGTNEGNRPAILAGLNPQNGNPTANTPFVVPNSNHFVFAELARADLLEGVVLDMMVGNNYNIVGKAFVKLSDDKLEIAVNGEGSFGAIAFNKLPVFNNGNIHSQKANDLAAFGALTGFDHDNKTLIPCPAGDTIYLYIHCDPLRFYNDILAW